MANVSTVQNLVIFPEVVLIMSQNVDISNGTQLQTHRIAMQNDDAAWRTAPETNTNTLSDVHGIRDLSLYSRALRITPIIATEHCLAESCCYTTYDSRLLHSSCASKSSLVTRLATEQTRQTQFFATNQATEHVCLLHLFLTCTDTDFIIDHVQT